MGCCSRVGEVRVTDTFRAIPQIMISFAAPEKITAMFGQYIAHFFFIFRHLRNYLGPALSGKIKINILMFLTIQFQYFRDCQPHLFHKQIERAVFKHQRNIAVLCYPHPRIIIPNKHNFVFVHLINITRITANSQCIYERRRDGDTVLERMRNIMSGQIGMGTGSNECYFSGRKASLVNWLVKFASSIVQENRQGNNAHCPPFTARCFKEAA